ncbi:hypothetical protein CC80DRAFT_592916 [Byssothecium circinans]|uniref:C3H1-type domain-containing protein n=1 Tax=Byssothecium circinans TaxID=147558 RepID=A0A6A5TYU6_9PLEO|nr:hypothetical protein CC80DRAFT_592916 [Byssothecium circinans]
MDIQQQISQLFADGGETFGELMVAAAKCGQELQAHSDDYEKLLAKHKQLEKKYEVMRVGYTAAAARGEDKEAYVVVLIDCHSHKFKNELVLDKASGGPKAAQLLRDSVREYLSKMEIVAHARECRVEFRAYANLKSLSLDAHKEKLADGQVRSLAPFTSGFSRPFGSCDFVDVQDEQAAQQKIRDVFKNCTHDPGCKQIFFAACCSPAHLQLLQSYTNRKGLVTLVQGEVTDQAMLKLGFKRVMFSQVFRSPNASSEGTGAGAKACWDFQIGKCTRKNCKFTHEGDTENAKLLKELDSNIHLEKTIQLPIMGNPGRIPVNANNERLDLYMRPPTKAQWYKYESRYKSKKLCNDFYLRHACAKNPCDFDHSPLEPDVYDCLKYVVKERPCKKKDECRVLGCLWSHVCQRVSCDGKGCKLPHSMHKMDQKVAEWVKPDAEQDEEEDDLNEEGAVDVNGEDVGTGAVKNAVLIEI